MGHPQRKMHQHTHCCSCGTRPQHSVLQHTSNAESGMQASLLTFTLQAKCQRCLENIRVYGDQRTVRCMVEPLLINISLLCFLQAALPEAALVPMGSPADAALGAVLPVTPLAEGHPISPPGSPCALQLNVGHVPFWGLPASPPPAVCKVDGHHVRPSTSTNWSSVHCLQHLKNTL